MPDEIATRSAEGRQVDLVARAVVDPGAEIDDAVEAAARGRMIGCKIKEMIVVGAADQFIGAAAADERVAACAALEAIFAVLAEQPIAVGATVEPILAVAAMEHVVACIAEQRVLSILRRVRALIAIAAAPEGVGPVAAVQFVLAVATDQDVGSGIRARVIGRRGDGSTTAERRDPVAPDRVAAILALEMVRSLASEQVVVAVPAKDRVVQISVRLVGADRAHEHIGVELARPHPQTGGRDDVVLVRAGNRVVVVAHGNQSP